MKESRLSFSKLEMYSKPASDKASNSTTEEQLKSKAGVSKVGGLKRKKSISKRLPSKSNLKKTNQDKGKQ